MHHASKSTLPATLVAAVLAACAPLPEDADMSAAPAVLCGAVSSPPAPPNGFACDPSPPDTAHALGDRFVLPPRHRNPAWPGELWRPEWYGNLGGAGRAPVFTTDPPPDPR